LAEAFEGRDVPSLLKEIIEKQDHILQGTLTCQQLNRSTLGVLLSNNKSAYETEQLREDTKTLRQEVEKIQKIVDNAQIPLVTSREPQSTKVRTISYSELFPIHQD
jgi:hypothetical protein